MHRFLIILPRREKRGTATKKNMSMIFNRFIYIIRTSQNALRKPSNEAEVEGGREREKRLIEGGGLGLGRETDGD